MYNPSIMLPIVLQATLLLVSLHYANGAVVNAPQSDITVDLAYPAPRHKSSTVFDTNAELSDGVRPSIFHRVNFFDASPRRAVTSSEESQYLAVNVVMCFPQGSLHPQPGAIITQQAGVLVENQLTVLTAAHIFSNEETNAWQDASDCKFSVFRDGRLADAIPVRSFQTHYAGFMSGDSDHDIAIVTLTRPSIVAITPLEISGGDQHRGSALRLVTIGPHTWDRRIISDASVCDKKGSPDERFAHLIIHSASTMRGDSGAPLIDEETQRVVAINVGWYQNKDQVGSVHFDCRRNYNRAVLIDDSIRQMLNHNVSQH